MNALKVYKVRIKGNSICSEHLIVLALSLAQAIEKSEKRIARSPSRYQDYEVLDAETIGKIDLR